MDWASTMQTNMDTFSKDKRTIPLVVSPDWDGVLSTVLFCEYARRKGIECTVVGTYDCKKIVCGESITDVEAALFLDLDLPMDKVCHIGQHLIGHVPLSNSCSFNPNHHFQNSETWTKFPFSTAHLIYYGLFQADERPICRQAEVALAHCDSSWSNARKYKRNCAAWTKKMFPGEVWMERLLDGRYKEECLHDHTELVQSIRPYVKVPKKRKRDGLVEKGWDACAGHQTAKDVTTAFPALLALAAAALKLPVPASQRLTKVLYSGTRKMVPLMEAMGEHGLEAFLTEKRAKSHAIVSSRMLSYTVSNAISSIEELRVE